MYDSISISKSATISGIQVAFTGQSLGKNYVMPVELYVPICHLIPRFLYDSRTVDQIADWDEHPPDKYGMIRRQPQIRVRLAFAERAWAHPDRPDIGGFGVSTAFDPCCANPRHWRQAPQLRAHTISGAERLHGNLPRVLAASHPGPTRCTRSARTGELRVDLRG